MQAGVAAVILDVVCSLGANVIKQKNWIHYIILIAAFVATFIFQINVIYIIIISAFVGVIIAVVEQRKGNAS